MHRSKNLYNPEWFRDLPITVKREFRSIERKVIGKVDEQPSSLKYISLAKLLSYLNVSVRTGKMYTFIDKETHSTLTEEQISTIQRTMVVVMKGPEIFKPFALKQLLYITHERTIAVKVYFKYLVTSPWCSTVLCDSEDADIYQARLIAAMKAERECNQSRRIDFRDMKEVVLQKMREDHRSDGGTGEKKRVTLTSLQIVNIDCIGCDRWSDRVRSDYSRTPSSLQYNLFERCVCDRVYGPSPG